MNKKITIGIDLGTTNSCAAYLDEDGKVTVIPEDGSTTLASAVSLVSTGKGASFAVGKSARERALREPTVSVCSAKRLIGLEWTEAKKAVEEYGAGNQVSAGPDDEPVIIINGIAYTVPQISGEVLTVIKLNAEKYLNAPIDSAVITVPAYFNDRQRAATMKAGKLAGLDVQAIISEPTAASLAYNEDGLIAVYDFGGGTFDISIVEKKDKKTTTVATNGDLKLGGDDIDRAILKSLLKQFQTEVGCKISDGTNYKQTKEEMIVIQRLRNTAEKLKIALSKNPELKSKDIELFNLWNGQNWTAHLTQGQLHALMKPFVDKSLDCCKAAFTEAGIAIKDIDAIVLVGGSTKAPYIQKRVAEFFGKEPDRSLNPDEAVAIGAAKSVEMTANDDFVDVTPLELFMETADKTGATLIKRHSPLPATNTLIFTNSKDGQTSINFVLRQGSRKSNVRLGTLILSGLEPLPAHSHKIKVDFTVTESGLMSIKATNVKTGKGQKLEIRRSLA